MIVACLPPQWMLFYLNEEMMFFRSVLVFVGTMVFIVPGFAQQKSTGQGIYVDKKGIMRWHKDRSEATFFGVNYTVPFAYGYRSVQRSGISPEQAIREDVYHFSRLGLDAFRVHVWDVEISDSVGNLKNNEHLRLFDFLIAELKKRKIRTLITPIAFWGNGYPEKDEDRGGFSSKYGRQKALTEEGAIRAQERYLTQFFQHKNSYTGLTYQQDPDVIAAEINNEPQHSGAKELATHYINRMVKAMRGTGWTKPIFYNISESPKYAEAIVKADVQGHSFQWYPTGLVAGHTLEGNYLPNVAAYPIPFDTIPAFKNRAKMVYEFDAADVMASYMYPAMAKSFRAAGFQWATQFAYDPMSTARHNIEYQTHYLNAAFTPAKAISLLIASKAFHQLPRAKAQSADTAFGDFRVSYAANLSEMNSAREFYYSNTTFSRPVATKQLEHVAGVGSSPLVQYQGTGAYWLDKLEEGVWRLEVMPDVVSLADPFARTHPDKTVRGIRWRTQDMQLALPDLGTVFAIKGLNAGNTFASTAAAGKFSIQPGTYLLSAAGILSTLQADSKWGQISLGEFVAPKDTQSPMVVLFDAEKDAERMMVYNPDWRHRPLEYPLTGKKTVKFSMPKNTDSKASRPDVPMLGFQFFFGDRLKGLGTQELPDTLVLRARVTDGQAAVVQIGLIDAQANFFAAQMEPGPEFREIRVPLNVLKPAAQLLLPRPYPGFLPLHPAVASGVQLDLRQLEKLELTFTKDLEISLIYLK